MKTKLTFLLLTLLTAYGYAQPQSWQWAKRAGSVNDNNGNPFNPTGNEMITDVKADKHGNVYAVGGFYSNTTLMNASTGLFNTGGYGGTDGYLIKYNSCGSILWWRRIGSTGNDGFSALVLDNNGQIHIYGASAASTATIDGNNGIDTIISGINGGFIMKFDTAGGFISKLDAANVGSKLFITGQGDYFLSNGIQAVKINTLGTITASYTYALVSGITTTLSGYFPPQIVGITQDKNDNVYVSGAYSNTINIGGGTILVPNGGLKSLIMKFSPNGTMLWYKTDNNTNILSTLLTCAVDTSGTKIIVGGAANNGANVFGYAVNVPNGPFQAATIYTLDANTGNLLSGITGTCGPNGLSTLQPRRADIDNNIICSATISGPLIINTSTYTSNGQKQNCIVKLNTTTGNLTLNMLPQSGSGYEAINAIDLNEQGNVYLGGMFGGTLDSLGTAVNIIGGTEDGFVAKYGFACNSNSTTLSPLPPTSLTAQYQATLTNYVTWVDNAQYENNYELWSSVNGGAFSLLTTLPANTTTYTHTGLSYTTTYCYKARAVNNIGASFFTNVGCVTTPATPTNTNGTAPNAPLNLTAANNGSLSNNVTWTDNSNDETNFVLHYTFGGSTTYSLLATLPANTTTYTHTGLTYTTNYCYQVAATNSVGTSAFSNTACASTPDNGTGIVETSANEKNVLCYPNPANTEVYFDIPSNEKQIDIELYNILGALVLSQKNYANRSAISISTLSKGLYYYKIKTAKNEYVGKVVKEE